MHLAVKLLNRIDDPNVSHDERARCRCQLSRELEEQGNYEGARGAMGGLWRHVGESPRLTGLNQATAATVLLRAGVLTGWLGSTQQLDGAQELAKDLITESITNFEALSDTKKVADARSEMAVCYWRLGAYAEARDLLRDARRRLAREDAGFEEDAKLEALVLLRSAMVEKATCRFDAALRFLVEAKPLFKQIQTHALKGKFHNELGTVLEKLGQLERRQDYIDRALLEFEAARFHFEQTGHTRHLGCVENNLGMLFLRLGKFTEAHKHARRARQLFSGLKDSVHAAQVDETRARVLLTEGRVEEAEKMAGGAVRTLGEGEESALLVEALTTQGRALAGLGKRKEALLILKRAIEVAEHVGALEAAGQAALTMIEELGVHLAPGELYQAYERAEVCLEKTQDASLLTRLRLCRRRVMQILVARLERVKGESVAETVAGGESGRSVEEVEGARGCEAGGAWSWDDFSLREEVQRYEARVIERALKDANGVVSRAARLLGFKHHHSLIAILQGRHRELLHARSPVVPRRRSIIVESSQQGLSREMERRSGMERNVRVVTILYVEDNRIVQDAVRETLRMEGWRVEICEDGETARRLIESDAPYDLLLVDNDLPGMSGMELVRLARSLRQRRNTPVIMLSASDSGLEARAAGADAFLRKPEDVLALVETIARLLASRARQN
ncbi:MAG TPA: response regulator [Pyrinomonadaceae bacterium]|jgi:CheY-like chemotaxis protein